jgi:mRNA interferase MazF
VSFATYHPDRGDLVHLNFSPQQGREIAQPHYAVVLSPVSYNRKAGLAVVCPITSKFHNSPWQLALPAGLGVGGWVYCDQIKSLDYRERGFQKKDVAPEEFVNEVLDITLTLLDPHQV